MKGLPAPMGIRNPRAGTPEIRQRSGKAFFFRSRERLRFGRVAICHNP